MNLSISSSLIEIESPDGEQLFTFEYAAQINETSVSVVQIYVQLGVISAIGDQLPSREIARIAQIKRLRQDLGLNLVGAAMVLDMATELAQLRSRLKVYQPK
jgi:MerR HTH family regulatory protein